LLWVMNMFSPESAPRADDFRPLPLLRNPHIQTLLGHLWPSPRWSHPVRRQVVRLADGDALTLYDTPPRDWQPGGPIALLVHGLTGSHASGQVLRIARMLLPQGWRVVRMDLRGAGPSVALARQSYHGGRSDDIRTAVEVVHSWSPTSPITIAGVSLGGNLVLKLAGEAVGRPVPGMSRVVALGPPIDLVRCADLISQPRNRLYDVFFSRELIGEARLRQRHFPDLPPLRFPRRMTVRLFDELYTAPRCGFADAMDYYRRASAFPLVPRIQVPTFILTARDDPFIPAEPFEELKLPANVAVRIAPHGGHLGFLGWDGAGGFRWGERRVAEWILSGGDERNRLMNDAS
jgi:predicted alpha/beta-fold hydrolase